MIAVIAGFLASLLALPLAWNERSRDPWVFPSSRMVGSSVSLEHHHSATELSRGKFLVASRQISDPRFMETVLLLIQHDSYGTAGLIINRPTEMRLSDIFPDMKGLPGKNQFTYIGGPVAMNQIQLLIHFHGKPQESQWVFGDVYVSSSKTVLEHLMKKPDAQTKFRAYVGYAGWTSGQLERELARGDWRVMEADADTIFDKAPAEIWPDLIRATEVIRINGMGDIYSRPTGTCCTGRI
ncbi:MAG TPA: YqgE/AlgH family protein [Thermodesulfovibrionales bacterium]|jgi:putative transcriptional regulator|nr:YqgE/AlgH family protein [Thermodesulfovibrionales bacterium]